MPAAPKTCFNDAVVTCPFTVPYARHAPHGAHWFFGRALAGLLQISGLPKRAIDGLCVSSFGLAPDTAVGLTEHLDLEATWLDHIPLGGASAIVSLRRALSAVRGGDAEVVACIAADTNRPGSFSESLEDFSLFSRDCVLPYGAGGPNASIALLTDHYMREWGATRADFGKLCVAQRENALHYPNALFKKPLTLEQYLAARPIATPIHLLDCVMPCAGAEAFLVMRQSRAEQLGLPFARVLSTSERHNAHARDAIQWRGGWTLDRDRLYAEAGIGPEEVDFVETYDDYPVMSFIQLEDLGFCAKGAAAELVRRHDLTAGGTFPINTCGGQLSAGQAGCAGSFLGLVEAIRQLSGQPQGRPVPNARFGLVVGFGMITYDRGLCSGAALLASAHA